MADFYPVLSRAVAALPVNTADTRQAIYERARAALLGQLKSIQPPMPEADIARQSDALSLAAARIEAEFTAAARMAELPLPVAEAAFSPSEEQVASAPVAEASVAMPLASGAEVLGAEASAAAWAEPAKPPKPTVQPPFFAPLPENEPVQVPAAEDRSQAAPGDLGERPPLEPPTLRPRVSAPPKPSDASGQRRTIIVGSIVGLTVLGIAILAYTTMDSSPQPGNGRAPAERAAEQRGGKLGERVGQDAAPTSSAVRPELPVAQRAVLYIENPEDPQKPQTVGGRVAWRLDSESVGQGRPVDTVVRASVEIPESGIMLTFTIRRNTDAAFPASHILGMRFARSSDDGNGVVKEAGVPQFKADEGERGAPLSAITSSLGDNLFVSALSNVPVEIDRNVDLMTRRNWIDIPVRFASGKRGIVAFEKGFSGDQTITDAFNRWR